MKQVLQYPINSFTEKYKGRRVSPFGAMRIAAIAARSGLGTVSPNPAVGCTILDSHYKVLSVGYHRKAGEAHAEIDAIKQLTGNDLQSYDFSNCHFYVTLEPCSHQGKTPSCAKTLAGLNIASLTYGLKDPNPLVNGRGLQILEDAGCKVYQVDDVSDKTSEDKKIKHKKELLRLTEVFFKNVHQKKPFVSLKVACSLDGQIGLQTGESQWITSETSRKHGHLVRSRHDAILVGVGTFLSDDPSLNIRHGRLSNPKYGKNLKVIVLDPSGRGLKKLSGSNLLKHHRPENIYWVVTKKIVVEENINIIVSKENSLGEIDLDVLLRDLFQKEICSVLIEGGARTASLFLKSQNVDRLYQYMAPSIVGDSGGKTWSEGFSIERLAEKIELEDLVYKKLNGDLLMSGKIKSLF